MRAALAVLVLTACTDLAGYRTDEATVYRGTVAGELDESFIRRGFAPGTELELEIDPTRPDRPGVGTVTTRVGGALAELDAVPLEPIPPLTHDLLSEYDFPGADRVANYLFVARPEAGPLAGRDVMVFVSLLAGGDAEVRVIAGAGDEARGDRFGVFHLRRAPR